MFLESTILSDKCLQRKYHSYTEAVQSETRLFQLPYMKNSFFEKFTTEIK